MIKGRKVYDPISREWSTGWWVPVYGFNGHIVNYVPVWHESIHEDCKYKNMLSKNPEKIIEILENKSNVKQRVFNRLRQCGGVKWYRYLDMSNPIIQWVNENLKSGGEVMSYFKKCPKCGRYMISNLYYQGFTVYYCFCGYSEDIFGGTYDNKTTYTGGRASDRTVGNK